ncbi:hypothetical protein [Magnetovibrio sp.]|uniref:hypothetical protein n=1 Tax=Magnetovibrio sp. TaxID=2024836 RepID=UPI002F956D39
MKPKNQYKSVENDAKLDADSQRVLAQCRAFFGVDELTPKTAELAATNITQALSSVQGPERRRIEAQIISNLESIQSIARRLGDEQAKVGAEIHALTVRRQVASCYANGGHHIARNKT